jgi:hypothetical protein
MTEEEWLKSQVPEKMFLSIDVKTSQRKYVLFSVACHHLPPAYNPGYLELLQRDLAKYTAAIEFVDGRISQQEVRQLWLEPGESTCLPERGSQWAKSWACPPFRDFEDPFECDVATLLRDIFGNPFRPVALSPAWRTSTVVGIASQMYDSREFHAMPILADAIQDAGCEDEAILQHCRDENGIHVRGCWVVDLVLGRQ